MTIKVRNSSGSWDTVDDVHIHNGTSFDRAKRVLEHDGTDFVEQHRSTWSYTFTTTNGIDDGPTHKQVNLATLTGIDKFYDVTITIDSGVTIYSDDTSTPAFKTGSGYGGTLTIINNGYIYGAGGAGGTGANQGDNPGGDGEDGGTALYLETDITLTDNGSILGGGGGGGGGGGDTADHGHFHSDSHAPGGGGGGGMPLGIGGTTQLIDGAQAGTAATLTAVGSGGVGGYDDDADGGDGGDGALPGSDGSDASGGSPRGAQGSGGIAGTAIDTNGYSYT